jgi:integrase
MARIRKTLSARSVETLKKPGMHADGGGLYLHVSASGARSWIFRWKRGGRSHDMGLGTAGNDDVGLAEARELASEARRVIRGGGDPIAARKAARLQEQIAAAKAMTFRQCAEAYIKAHSAGWRNPKHAAQWPATLGTYAYPVFGELPVQAIDTALVMKAIEPIWTVKPETASRVRGRIESVLDWATARSYRQGENPARWRGHLDKLLPARSKVAAVEHHAALPYAELGDFMVELRQHEGIAARALEFAILTAARTGEVIGARWNEINFAERLWIVPAERMKSGKEHRVPLSEAALALLREMNEIRHSAFVFPGHRTGRSLSSRAMRQLLQRIGRTDLTVHGFRAAFTDWAAERSNFPAEVRQMALAHVVSDKVEAAYRRGDLFQKRRQLADAWTRYCTAPASPGGVVAIGSATRRQSA